MGELFDRGRVKVMVAALAVEVTLFAVGLLTPLSASTQQNLAQQANSQLAPLQSSGFVQMTFLIFGHNLTIAFGEMIPLLGALILLFSIFTTGLAAQALVVSQGLSGPWALLIFVFPYSIIEFSGYAIATGAGVMLFASWRRKRLRQELRIFVLEGAAVAAVLSVAAAMETATNFSPLLGLALWVPTGLAAATMIVVRRKRRRNFLPAQLC